MLSILRALTPFASAVCIVILLLCSGEAGVRAEALDDLRKIDEALNKKSQTKKNKEARLLLSGKWLVAGSNFARLFLQEKGPLNLLEWVGTVIPGFTPRAEASRRKPEYVSAEKTFRDHNLNQLVLTILVPHPKFASVVDLGLEADFARYEPPFIKILASEKIELRAGFSAMVYSHDDGACSLVIKAPRSSMINISGKTCAIKSSLIDLAQKLDLERLSMKLQS